MGADRRREFSVCRRRLAAACIVVLAFAAGVVWLTLPSDPDSVAPVPLPLAPPREPVRAPAPPPPPPRSRAARPKPAPPPAAPVPTAVPAEPPASEIDEPKREAARGPWWDGWPDDLTPDGFTQFAQEALRGCDPGFAVELVDIDCSAAPCYAIFATPRRVDGFGNDRDLARHVAGCEGWRSRYGTRVDRDALGSRSISCEGSGERWLFALTTDRAFTQLDPDTVEMEVLKQDQQSRLDVYADVYTCP